MTGPIARAILAQTAADHGLPVAVMLEKVRSPDRVAARFDAMRRLRAITRLDGRPRFSLPQIGEMLGLHHTSVLNGLRRMEAATPVSPAHPRAGGDPDPSSADGSSSRRPSTPLVWTPACAGVSGKGDQ